MRIELLNVRIATTQLTNSFCGGNYQILGRTAILCEILSAYKEVLGFGMIELDHLSSEEAKQISEAKKLLHEWTNYIRGMEVLDRGYILKYLAILRSEKYQGCENEIWDTALGVLDIALWDAFGRSSGQPLWRIFGGTMRKIPAIAIEGYYEPEGDDPAEHIKQIVTKCQNEWKVAGLKIKVGRAPISVDLLRVAAAREVANKDFILAVDANCSWTVEQARQFAREAVAFDLRWIEEPFPLLDDGAIEEQARLREFGIPINAGQSEKSPSECLRLLNHGAVDILNFMTQYYGGLTPGHQAAMLAHAYGVEVTHVTAAPVAGHLVAGVPNGIAIELFVSPERDPFWRNLYSKRPQLSDGYIRFTEEPGLGILIDEDYLTRVEVK